MADESATPLHERYMRRCLELGRVAASGGESPVGSVIVRSGRVIAEASEETNKTLDVSAHAELVAIRRASASEATVELSGCTLYTNVEPCISCSYAIRRASIARVVFGAPAGVLGGVTSRYPILTEAGVSGFGAPPIIEQGVLLDECTALLQAGQRR